MTDAMKGSAPAGEIVLSLRGICKHFGAVSALTDIDLDVRAGEVVALVGDNGAGKSTLVKILAGVHQPSAGTIMFGGKAVALADPSASLALGIATVFQDLALCENLDVVANIFLGKELRPLQLDEVSMEIRAWTLLNELSARIPSVREFGRLAFRRPAPDGRDSPVAAAPAEADPARRADRGTRGRTDRRGARPHRAGPRSRPRRDHDQPQHGGRARSRGSHCRAAARAQQRRLLSRCLEPGTGQRHHRSCRQLGLAPVRTAAGQA